MNEVIKHTDMRMMPLSSAKEWFDEFVGFSKSIMRQGLDYGVIPGTPKPSLYKAGAEKLALVYGLGTEIECIERSVDLDRPFIDYTYRCTVKTKTGQVKAQCEGSCNSMEAKFGYLWKRIDELPEGVDISNLPVKTSGQRSMEFAFAIDKKETTGRYGKPAEYWAKWEEAIMSGKATKGQRESKTKKMLDVWEFDETVTLYRIPNPDVVGLKNTIMKMAQKRAFVGAILLATGASEFYTQDIEDMDLNGKIASEDEAEIIVLPPIKTSQYTSAIKRIRAGELDVYHKVLAEFSVTQGQAEELRANYEIAKENKK